MIVTVHKPPGWTPLEAMEALRARTPELTDEPMVYAGRLDPMAEGLLLVLTGDDRYALPAHLGHDKDYDATFLFGLSSDTFDALGRLAPVVPVAPSVAACAAAVAGLTGAHALPLPAWSAYKVKGRPLHAWAREGRLHEIELPVRRMQVTAVGPVSGATVRADALIDDVLARIDRVRGQFRQDQARADWLKRAAADPPLVVVRAELTVTSGTFVRSLAHNLGERLGCGGLLLALRRTRIGDYR
jgi:tRNA pseudouridine55 synthase